LLRAEELAERQRRGAAAGGGVGAAAPMRAVLDEDGVSFHPQRGFAES